jgi:hypothetical protein
VRILRHRSAPWIALAAIAISFVTNAVVTLGSDYESRSASGAVFFFGLLTFPIVGMLILTRMPGNTIGWILVAIGLGWAFSWGDSYAQFGATHAHTPGSLPGAAAAAQIGQAQWIPPVALMGTYLLLLFPNGKLLPGPRWRFVARLSAVGIVLGSVAISISPGKMVDAGFPHTDNPLGVSWLPPALLVIGVALIPICIVASAVSLVVRFRRSSGVERLQLKWLVSAAAFVAVVYLCVFPLSIAFSSGAGSDPAWLGDFQAVCSTSFFLIPISIGFAVLRHNLYGIDVIIRRTVLYAGVVALLGTLYVAGIWAVGASLRTLTARSDAVAVTLSTLVVVAAFQPVRARVQRALDHRFYRAKYDAQAAIEALSRTLGQQVDLAAVEREVLAVVARTVRPAHAGLWLRTELVTIPERSTGTTERT